MKSRTMFVVLMSGAGALCALTPAALAADASSATENASAEVTPAPEARPSLQISSEIAPDFLVPAPQVSPSISARAQWQNNPLLQSQLRNGVWLNGSDVQLLDAPPDALGAVPGFEIEILPAQPRAEVKARANVKAATTGNSAVGLPIQTRQAAKIAVERAQLLESAGVPVMAGAQLRRAVALAPHDIAARRALAQWTAQHQQWPEAAAQWREVLYQLKMQSDAPQESVERELWRVEATREMRTAQDHLMAFWQVPNVVTLGADSKNLVARSTPSATASTAITLAMTSTALTPTATPRGAQSKVVALENVAAKAAAPVIVPLVTPAPELRSEAAPSTLENLVAVLPERQTRRELRFEIVVTSASYLQPQNVQNRALRVEDEVEITKVLNANKTEAIALKPVSANIVDSSREQARLFSMQRQMQPWLGDIVRIGSDSAAK